MQHRLGVGRDAVVFYGAEVHEFRAEAAEDGFDEGVGFGAGAVLDEDEGLADGVDFGAVEGVAGDDFDVGGEVELEGFNLGGFARGLAAYYRANLGRFTVARQF